MVKEVGGGFGGRYEMRGGIIRSCYMLVAFLFLKKKVLGRGHYTLQSY